MNQAMIDKIVQTVLYEGYILYPYRRSVKNQQRWTFGCLFPREYNLATHGSEPCSMQTQFLLRCDEKSQLSVTLRFLQLVDRSVAACDAHGASSQPLAELEIDGKRYQSWQEAVEQKVMVAANLAGVTRTNFEFPASKTVELIRNSQDRIVATVTRTGEAIHGTIEIESLPQRNGVNQITMRVENNSALSAAQTMTRDGAQLHGMASTHAILNVKGGSFISVIDPPPSLADLARQCKQIGAWPVLVGETGETDVMLASPIILYDYPQLAPESPGDLFDGTEIDEILSLRVMTLSDDEKKSAADLDERAAALIGRTEALARDQLARLHGTMRSPGKVLAVHVGASELRKGDRVRLQPSGRADAFDIILRGKTATIIAIEQDYESRIHLAVTIDDDPGADIGVAGQIGHRFFFRPEEVEPLNSDAEVSTP